MQAYNKSEISHAHLFSGDQANQLMQTMQLLTAGGQEGQGELSTLLNQMTGSPDGFHNQQFKIMMASLKGVNADQLNQLLEGLGADQISQMMELLQGGDTCTQGSDHGILQA